MWEGGRKGEIIISLGTRTGSITPPLSSFPTELQKSGHASSDAFLLLLAIFLAALTNKLSAAFTSVSYCSFRAVLDCLMMPVQNKLEEWKKVASALDKDHAKGERFSGGSDGFKFLSSFKLGGDAAVSFLHI